MASIHGCEEAVSSSGPGPVRLGGAVGPVAGVTQCLTGGADALREVAGHSRNWVAFLPFWFNFRGERLPGLSLFGSFGSFGSFA